MSEGWFVDGCWQRVGGRGLAVEDLWEKIGGRRFVSEGWWKTVGGRLLVAEGCLVKDWKQRFEHEKKYVTVHGDFAHTQFTHI